MKKAHKALTPDYRLLIAPHFNERTQRQTTRVTLETVRAFAAFRYDLSVEETIADKTIAYKVLGLSTPQLNLPAAGPATFSTEHDALNGTYAVSVEGLDGRISTFSVRITPKQVKLLRPAAGMPIDIVTDERLWSTH